MKHTLKITFLLFLLFLMTHVLGLVILNQYNFVNESGKDLPYGLQPPEIEQDTSFIPIFFIILFGTVLMLILARFKTMFLWKFWFFISLMITLTISFGAFFAQGIALGLALILALFRIFKYNTYIHNFSELFVYGGLAAIFVPVFNLWSISILLILISIYDFISVFKTKHMVKLAKFQSKGRIFAGLYVPYEKKAAILGGGDIGFTLLFSGVILKNYGALPALLVSFIVGISLLGLLYYGRKNKFYPAMPPLTFGCFIGLLAVNLLF
ncbi:hypothetical protein HY500_03280 [Candidatus Woesearchaeota archaeon]|nr:hypothetical protein [Candidatus Woesearchaeota archaeon]